MGKAKKSKKNFRADPTSVNGNNGHGTGHNNGDFLPIVTNSVLDTISAQLQSGGF